LFRENVPIAHIKQLINNGEKIGFFTPVQHYRWKVYYFKMLIVNPLGKIELSKIGMKYI
jgi:hypothetical protein